MTIIKKFEPEEKKSIYSKKYGVLIGLVLFVLTIVQIWTSNTIVTYGERYDNLSKLSKSLLMENQVLENEIAKEAAITNIALGAARLGFSKSESIQYIR